MLARHFTLALIFSRVTSLTLTLSPFDAAVDAGRPAPFSYYSSGAVLPLTLAFHSVAGGAWGGGPLGSVALLSDHSNQEYATMPNWVGHINATLCDSSSVPACTEPSPLTLLPWAEVTGVATSYAPGADFVFQYQSGGLVSPYVTLELRDNATRTSVAQSWSILSEAAPAPPQPHTAHYALPAAAVAPGYYCLYVCAPAVPASNSLGGCLDQGATLAVGRLTVSGVDPTPGARLNFSFSASPGLDTPLAVELLHADSGAVALAVLGEARGAWGTELIDLVPLPAPGAYALRVCERWGLLCFSEAQPPVIFTGALSLSGLRNLSYVYPLDAALSFSWATEGATLPLNVSVRRSGAVVASFATGNSAATDGTGSLPLSGLPAGWYSVWLCDARGFCAAPPADICYVAPPEPQYLTS